MNRFQPYNNRPEQTQQHSRALSFTPVADWIIKFLISSSIILLFSMLLMSENAFAGNAQRAAIGPDHLIANTTNTMLAALQTDREQIKKDPQRIYTLATDIALPHFDFQRMSSWVLGKYWRRASDEQKQRFPKQFKNLILRTYATALSEYTDESVSYLPLRSSLDSGEVSVQTLINRSSGPAIPVTYSMHNVDGLWKVYDIKIDGISLVSNYRRSFSSEIRRHGLDSLINKLASRNTAE